MGLGGISKGTFEIPHKISSPYIQIYICYTIIKLKELLDLGEFFESPPPPPPLKNKNPAIYPTQHSHCDVVLVLL